MSNNEFARRAALIVFVLVAATSLAAAQTTISLGAAEKVAILGGSTITNGGPTSVIGNLALRSPGVYHFDIAATDVLLSGNARFEGILMANLRTVRLSGQSRVTGEVIAKKIVMSGGSQITHPPVVSPEQPPTP